MDGSVRLSKFEREFLRSAKGDGILEVGDRVLVALSGGSDSVALFTLLVRCSSVMKFGLGVAHCNFKLRESADRDALFCRHLCERYSVPFFSEVFHVRGEAKRLKQSIETTARDLRYSFFSQVMLEQGYGKVATAHHAGDNVETILFNLFRGGSVWAVQGIPKRRDGGVVRPLLGYRKAELEEYLKNVGQEYVVDETNFCTDYDRNFIRHELIPVIEKRFESRFSSSLIHFSETVREAHDFIDGLVGRLMLELRTGDALLVEGMARQDVFIQKEIFKRTLWDLLVSVTNVQLARLVWLVGAGVGKKVVLSRKWVAVRTGRCIEFRRRLG